VRQVVGGEDERLGEAAGAPLVLARTACVRTFWGPTVSFLASTMPTTRSSSQRV
jgi:hypothetical protein